MHLKPGSLEELYEMAVFADGHVEGRIMGQCLHFTHFPREVFFSTFKKYELKRVLSAGSVTL